MTRARFAPSPTGFVHLGSLRTALYNFLFARHTGGANILRIEDTDRTRYVEGAVDNLIRTMEWCGITFDEGPEQGGEYGSYTQSERTQLYREHSDKLIASGHAYKCFCSAERLDEIRKAMQAKGEPPMYDRHCRNLSAEEVEKNIADGNHYVVRLRVPLGETITFNDLVRGDVSFESRTIDDQVLLKSDGFPTYHLANVVDDKMMKVTNVIRGEEWLSSTPKHVLLYRAFGWENDMPKFAHLPLLLNPDRSKLSKRQGDVFVEEFRNAGYLDEALVNYVALLGWNPSATEEIYSMQELIEKFELSSVNKAGAVFDRAKLDWMNAEYIRKKTDSELLELLRTEIENGSIGEEIDRNRISEYFNKGHEAYLLNVIRLMKDRVRVLPDFFNDFSKYFYERPTTYDEKSRAKNWTPEAKERLTELITSFKPLDDWSHQSIEAIVRSYAESKEISAGKLIHPLRLAVSGVGMGPGLFELLEILGKEEVTLRIDTALTVL